MFHLVPYTLRCSYYFVNNLQSAYILLTYSVIHRRNLTEHYSMVCFNGLLPFTKSEKKTGGVWTNHGNYNNDVGDSVSVCVRHVFSKQTSGISVYSMCISVCAEIEQRALCRSQPTTFSWHQFFFCCGSCQKQKVRIPSLQQGPKPPALFGMTGFDLTSKTQQAWSGPADWLCLWIYTKTKEIALNIF